MGHLTERYQKLDEQIMQEIRAYSGLGVEWVNIIPLLKKAGVEVTRKEVEMSFRRLADANRIVQVRRGVNQCKLWIPTEAVGG